MSFAAAFRSTDFFQIALIYMMMSKTIETKLLLHYMTFPFQGTHCLELYASIEVLTVVIFRTTNAFFRLN